MNHCYRKGIPFFVNSDNNIRCDPRHPAYKRFIKQRIYDWWMKRVSGVFSMGEFGDQFFMNYGAKPDRLYRLPYWPDYDAFTHVDPVELERFQQKFSLNRRQRHVLYSGRLVPVKRVDLLIDAFVNVASSHPEWNLLIVGDGIKRDELQRRVPQELRQRVVWTGFLEGRELAVAYHAADTLVLPSDHENWALVVQEAMAAGLPVIASDVVGAAREMVVDGQGGRIFKTGDINSLQRSLEEVIRPDNIERYKDEAKLALKRYRERVNPVAEVRRALTDAGVLPKQTQNRTSDSTPAARLPASSSPAGASASGTEQHAGFQERITVEAIPQWPIVLPWFRLELPFASSLVCSSSSRSCAEGLRF
jgi:glycosyltransferase involved in cell wall biosynthesis